MLSDAIKSEIDQLWDKFWSGGISNPLTAIEQISYLLFIRRLDEIDQERIDAAEFTGEKYESIFKGEFKLNPDDDKEKGIKKELLKWSNLKEVTDGNQLLDRMQRYVFPFIKQLNGKGTPFARHMQDAVFIMPKPSLLIFAMTTIDKIYKLIEEEVEQKQTFQDTQGDMYEFLLNEIASAGKNGQFRTPRHIIKMICELINPTLQDIKKGICDPACGTGGFLLGAYLHILAQNTSKELLSQDINGIIRGIGDKVPADYWPALRKKAFYGFDFDPTMVRIGLMNLLLHGISEPQIECKDTLSKKHRENNQYGIVLANPPFKGSIDKGDINEDLKLSTTKTELLFVNKIINMLRIGGRAGVIIPSGVLSTSTKAFKDLRKMLVEDCELQAVISMPSGVFKPYAGVAAAVLIFTKGGKTENTWFYTMDNDGFSLDDKRNPIDKNDIPDIIEKYQKKEESDKSFLVSKKNIIDNDYSLLPSTYKAVEYEPIVFEYTPQEYVDKMIDLENEILSNLKDLKSMIGELK